MCRMYSKLKLSNKMGKKLKHYHHVNLDSEFISDALVWTMFLTDNTPRNWCHPFVDSKRFVNSTVLQFFTDSSAAEDKGFGCIFENEWVAGLWGRTFIKNEKPSIQYLELYALCVGVLTWAEKLQNLNIVIFCDNQAVVQMVNNYTSSCQNCMRLLRVLVLDCLIHNHRITVEYVTSKDNFLADSLSRGDYVKFWRKAPKTMKRSLENLPAELWPIGQVWKRPNKN